MQITLRFFASLLLPLAALGQGPIVYSTLYSALDGNLSDLLRSVNTACDGINRSCGPHANVLVTSRRYAKKRHYDASSGLLPVTSPQRTKWGQPITENSARQASAEVAEASSVLVEQAANSKQQDVQRIRRNGPGCFTEAGRK